MTFRRIRPGATLVRCCLALALIVAAMASSITAVSVRARTQTPGEIVSYRFHYRQAGDTAAAIEIAWTQPLAAPRALIVPRAIPMGYGEQRYDAFVSDVRAYGAGDAGVLAEREEGPRWRLPAGTRRVTYRVDLRGMERDVRAASDASRVRDGYLSVLGYSVFAYLDGGDAGAVRLRVEGPEGWPVLTTLAPAAPATTRPLDVRAPDFYALADSQIVMGPRLVVRRLTDMPVPLYLAAYVEGPVDLDRVGRAAVTAFQRVAAYFDEVPFEHYTIHQELLAPISPQHEYGMSMEHLNSSTYYLAASTGLTTASTPEDDARVLYNFAHHITHAWIPKRAYGPGYFPFQWELAPVLDSIWFAEGFGQYAAIVALAAGMADPAAYRHGLLTRRFQANITSAPPFLKQLPLVELSRIASTRYAEDFRTGRLVFSRGGLMAAAIDDRIQSATGGRRSLRDALRFLVAWTARERRAFAIDELAGLIQQATGIDTSDVIAQWLRPLPQP